MRVFADTRVLVAASASSRRAKTFDARLRACAARSEAECIHTFNLGSFRGLAAAGLQVRLCLP